jgi:hypothetical protein
MNKQQGTKSAYRGLGSIDFQAVARSVLLIGRTKENPELRIVAHEKVALQNTVSRLRLKLVTAAQSIGKDFATQQ